MTERRVDRPTLKRSLETLCAETTLAPRDGFFGPRSAAWTVFRERALVTYAPRAVMLQYAYPPFAAASASYGAQAKDPGARFERAVATLLRMIFGERELVLREARRLFLLHDRLHGTLLDGGTYHGNDRASLAWILVTLLDASIRGYERHVGRIDEPALFAEFARFAALFGLTPGAVPATRVALDATIDEAVRTRLVVGTEARAMWTFLGQRSGPVRGWAAATLPAAIRLALGSRVSTRRAHAIERAGSVLRAALLPPSVRYVDAYRR